MLIVVRSRDKDLEMDKAIVDPACISCERKAVAPQIKVSVVG